MNTEARSGERDSVIRAADGSCPRCGATRDPDQRYCLECGLVLPESSGRLPALRRRWIRQFGWYPGDWVWGALASLLVAVAGTAVAIVLTAGQDRAQNAVTALDEPVSVTTRRPVPERLAGTTATPRKRATTPQLVAWPRNENGWTIVLVSEPKRNGGPNAESAAHAAATSSLRQVGILDSSLYPSLQPGYLVVFTGIYATKSDADAGVSTARQAGFGGAYSRQISR